MKLFIKPLAVTIAVCITFLAVTALYLIWSEPPPASLFLARCTGTAALIAAVCAIMLSLCDTMIKHQSRGKSESDKSQQEEG